MSKEIKHRFSIVVTNDPFSQWEKYRKIVEKNCNLNN